MKTLILGCGKHHEKQEGQTLVDIHHFNGVDYVQDLNNPWIFAGDKTFDRIWAIHLVEHLNSLVQFMDEAWRVLKDGGSLYIETPLAGGDPDLEFADPTHKRCYRRHSFINYFTIEGIEKFGYTDRAWSILELRETKDGIIIFHGMPLR